MSSEFHQTGHVFFRLLGCNDNCCQPIENYSPKDSDFIIWEDIAKEAISQYLETHNYMVEPSIDNCVVAFDVVVECDEIKIKIEKIILPFSIIKL